MTSPPRTLDKRPGAGYRAGMTGKGKASSRSKSGRPGGAKAPRAGRRVRIAISNPHQAVRCPAAKLRRLIEFVARAEGQRVAAVDLAVVDSGEMAALNRRYLHRPGPTDVLVFDLSDAGAGGIVAQIVVCGDLAVAQAAGCGHTPPEELMLYVVHGLLHAMGYDDTAVRAAAKMHAREDDLLGGFLRHDRSARAKKAKK